MLNATVRRMLHRRTAAFVLAAGIAAATLPGLTAPASSASAAGSAIPAAAVPKLTSTMLRLARRSGDAHPASIRAVATSRDRALRAATPGDTIPGSTGQSVYLVVLTGRFRLNVPVPPHAKEPTGRYLAVTVNPVTFWVMDLGLSNRQPPVSLRSLGPVSNLAK